MKKALAKLAFLSLPFSVSCGSNYDSITLPSTCVSPGENYAQMDDCTHVRVENASSYDNARVHDLVVAADRSTQQDGSQAARIMRKGLFHRDDVVVVTDNYLAWMDFSKGDGAHFNSPPFAEIQRNGTLSGIWTLDPSTRNFKHSRLSPNGVYWARNELIPGSASPEGQQNWWDPYAFPTEHSMALITPDCPLQSFNIPKCFFSFEYSLNSANSGYQKVKDGAKDAEGIHFMQTALMTSWRDHVDIHDGDDSNGIQNTMNASREYVFRPNDILVRFNFTPARDTVLDNLYIAFWTHYAHDIDRTPCDPTRPNFNGSLWPDMNYYDPLYTKSSKEMHPAQENPNRLPPGIAYKNIVGPTCLKDEDGSYINYGFYTRGEVVPGDWLMMGESPTLSPDKSRMKLTYLGGAGGQEIEMKYLNVFDETSDGTWGMSICRGPHVTTELKGGVRYGISYSLNTSTE